MPIRDPYPGHTATVQELTALANEYREASRDLLQRGRRGNLTTWAPARLMAIHAIELQLNAFLLHHGFTAEILRGMQHDLAKRVHSAATKGLILRTKTRDHLYELSTRREYLVTRYGPEMLGICTQINRLTATLDEIVMKTSKAIAKTDNKHCAKIATQLPTDMNNSVPALEVTR